MTKQRRVNLNRFGGGRGPSPSLAVAGVALFAALGGTGYAATKLPSGSVGATQLKPRAVNASRIAPNAITSAKVKDGSLAAKDFKAGELPAGRQGPAGRAGPAGPQGPKGDAGPAGAPGVAGYEVVTSNLSVSPGSGDYYDGRTITAQCPSGKTVIGGGYDVGTIASSVVVHQSRPTTARTGWEIRVYNGQAYSIDASAYAICARL